MKKKLIAIILVVVLVLTAVASALALNISDIPTELDKYIKDAKSITANFEEAILLMLQKNIMKGDDLGNINPQDTLRRSEAAKMIAVISNNFVDFGVDEDGNNIVGDSDYYADLLEHWASVYVDFLTDAGAADGDGTGNFLPDNDVTAPEFLKFLLVFLGYDADESGYVNDPNWVDNILRDASAEGLLKGFEIDPYSMDDIRDPVTREMAAYMIMLTLINKGLYEPLKDKQDPIIYYPPFNPPPPIDDPLLKYGFITQISDNRELAPPTEGIEPSPDEVKLYGIFNGIDYREVPLDVDPDEIGCDLTSAIEEALSPPNRMRATELIPAILTVDSEGFVIAIECVYLTEFDRDEMERPFSSLRWYFSCTDEFGMADPANVNDPKQVDIYQNSVPMLAWLIQNDYEVDAGTYACVNDDGVYDVAIGENPELPLVFNPADKKVNFTTGTAGTQFCYLEVDFYMIPNIDENPFGSGSSLERDDGYFTFIFLDGENAVWVYYMALSPR